MNSFLEKRVTDTTNRLSHARCVVLLVLASGLAACGGSGGGDSSGTTNPPPSNTAPVVNAGADQTVDEGTTVSLSATASDANGDTLSYTWTQTAGTTVTLSGANSATATFTAPSVSAAEVLDFQVAVSDGTVSVSDAMQVTVNDTSGGSGTTAPVSGKAQYEFVPPNNNCRGLDFGAVETRPIRRATVQLLDAGGSVLASTVTDDNGDYAFSNVATGQTVSLRVLAELKRSGAPGWDVEVRDNVLPSGSSTPLEDRAMYALDSTTFPVNGSTIRNITATTGWDGSSYSGPRAAAPFAILDSIYSGMLLVLSVDPTASFAEMDAFWSVNNTLVSGSPLDIDAGELTASFYRSDLDSLFLLGDASVDTEEFDDHVIVHEWGHYFEDNFSRSDSTGGPHAIGDRIDARLAFGEGWATALAGIALENQLYCDTGPAGSQSGFGIGAESGSFDPRGWYDELSIVRFIYDLWDTDDEGGDPGSIGFGPIYNVMTGEQAGTEAFTTVFSFATELRSQLNSADRTFLDSQLVREDMNPVGLNIWGEGELNDRRDAEFNRDVLPIYTDVPLDGTTINICTNSDYDDGRDGNKLAERRFLRMTVVQGDIYDVTIRATTSLPPDDPADERDQSDPDIFIYRNGTIVAAGTSGDANEEIFPTQNFLSPGIYVADLMEFRYRDDDSPTDFPEQICFDVSMAPQ